MSRQRILIEHQVAGRVPEVFAGFTKELFDHLTPAFPPAKLLRYDGNQVGDEVHIRLGLPPVAVTWVSVITKHEAGKREAYFVDEGVKLPPPLTFWRHKHLLVQTDAETVSILEDITFATGNKLTSALMYPVLYAQFAARGPLYKSYFTNPQR